MGDVTVIIVNYNGGAGLQRCLACLHKQTRAPERVIVADNASTDGSFEAAQKAFPGVTFCPMGDNLGFAAANNRAVEKTSTTFIALLNPDAYAEPMWLEALLDAAARHPDAASIASAQLIAEDPSRIDGAGDCLHAAGLPYRGLFGAPRVRMPSEGLVAGACGAAALYRRDHFIAAGGFDERFFCYCEDIDLSLRLSHAGGETIFCPSAVILHEGSGITGRHSPFTVYHGCRNRIWLTAKTLPPLLYWLLLPVRGLVNVAFALRFLATPAAGAYWRGLIDGVRGVPKLRRERRQTPSETSWRFARRLVWSPFALLRRSSKVRPLV